MHSISIAPNFTVTGAVFPGDEPLPNDIEERLHKILLEGRYIGAINTDPARTSDDELSFTLACDSDLRMLRVGKTGKIVAGKLLENLEAELNKELGFQVSLDQDVEFDEDDDDVDEDSFEAFEELELDDEDDSDDLDEDDEDDLDEDDWPEHLPVWEDVDEPERKLLFSRRGSSNAALLSWLTKTPVETGVLDDWSVYRYLDSNYTEIPSANRQELPSIEVSFTDSSADGWASVTVVTENNRDEWGHTLFPTATRHSRAVLTDGPFSKEAAQLQAIVMNPNLHRLSDANQLIADPGLNIDAEALHQAIGPEFEGTTVDRVRTALAALGVPEALGRPAVEGDPLPNQQRFEGRRGWQTILQVAEQGEDGIRPLGTDPTFYGRAEKALRERPLLGLVVASAEALIGTAALVGGLRSRGLKRGAGILGGLLLIADATIDAVVIRRRNR